tara:strand:- start:743 stop:1270 length:528 start_codon:yes stop_codon:yes gene_type:complete
MKLQQSESQNAVNNSSQTGSSQESPGNVDIMSSSSSSSPSSSSSSSSSGTVPKMIRRFSPRELDFEAKAGDYVAVYPAAGESTTFRFWLGRTSVDIPVDGSKRKLIPIIYYKAVEGDYLLFEQESLTEVKLAYSVMLGKFTSAKEVKRDGNVFIAISLEERDNISHIALELDKEK